MRLTALTSAAVLAVALIAPAPASAAPTPDPALGMQQALQRDLGLTADQARVRQAHEAAAPVVERDVRDRLGSRFAGAWYSPEDGRLKVGVLDDAAAAQARAAGALPVRVGRSEQQLDAVKARLDGKAATAGRDVHGWYVDVAANTVTVSAANADAARRFVAASGLTAAQVRVVTGQAPRPLYDIRGGDQYVINGNTLCSIGFSVNGGFVTAGHCGGTGSPTLGYNNVSQGNFAGSSFPGNDYAWVRTNANWTPRPWVNNYGGGNVTVAGSQESAIGASICRSGRTTGWRCGTVQAKNVTVNYSDGRTVYGLTQTTACAEGGDSGGAWMSGNQAQGVTSGGSGNCSTGGTTFFQPVNEILGAYGLTLTTSGGGGSTSRIIGWQDKCIDVPNSNFVDGQRLQLWDCNGTNAQNWTFPGDGTIRTVNGMCMDVAWGSTAPGAAIQIVGCSGNPAQQFVLTGAGDLVNPQANKCVDVTGWGGTGTPLSTWDCTGGANQKWRRG
ncbi:ricin-type beta-trefoil lectin domain protein [Catellatospora methionotrophica]|uniref:ricin-type beta-trefoil lectin domain protein n=1 Tax=Catellatospora methionotrophica TaxID=121620 RepID=UPI0033F78559